MTITEARTNGAATTAGAQTLTVRDDRTGKSYVIPVVDGYIRASELRKIKASSDDEGLLTYDPGFMATAAVKSGITYIDGERGILRYRGYPIDEIADRCGFLEVAYLL